MRSQLYKYFLHKFLTSNLILILKVKEKKKSDSLYRSLYNPVQNKHLINIAYLQCVIKKATYSLTNYTWNNKEKKNSNLDKKFQPKRTLTHWKATLFPISKSYMVILACGWHYFSQLFFLPGLSLFRNFRWKKNQ